MKSLEQVIEEKLAIKSIPETFYEDLTTKIRFASFYDIPIETSIKFKPAKKKFKVDFLRNILRKNLGNISQAAKIANINRRSIHRLFDEHEIKQLRNNLPKIYDIKVTQINNAFHDIVENYKNIVPFSTLKKVNKKLNKFVDNIIDIPNNMTLKTAEKEFEKIYLKSALKKYSNTHNTASQIGISIETLNRKRKKLEI